MSTPSVFRRACVGVFALLATASVAQATVNNYGNLVGPNVMYLGVTEVATEFPGPMPPTLLGAPLTPPGSDILAFNPVNFVVGVQNGQFQFQDARLTVNMIKVNNPQTGSIPLLQISEGGAWAVGGGAGDAVARASLIVQSILITEVNGVPLGSSIVVNPSVDFTHTIAGSATVVEGVDSIQFTSAGGIGNGSWDATATFNLAGALAANNIQGRVTKLNLLSLDNQLVGTSSHPNQDNIFPNFAFIDKKDLLVRPVPEPGTIVLGLLGGLGLAVVGYRRKLANLA